MGSPHTPHERLSLSPIFDVSALTPAHLALVAEVLCGNKYGHSLLTSARRPAIQRHGRELDGIVVAPAGVYNGNARLQRLVYAAPQTLQPGRFLEDIRQITDGFGYLSGLPAGCIQVAVESGAHAVGAVSQWTHPDESDSVYQVTMPLTFASLPPPPMCEQPDYGLNLAAFMVGSLVHHALIDPSD